MSLLCQLVLAFGLLGSTCVAVTGQRGPVGPWVGEVGNGTQYPISEAAVFGRVFDAENAPLGYVMVPTCPAYLAPGERGTFEIFTPPSLTGRPPFRVEVEPRLGGFGGSQGDLPDYIPRYQSDGLSVRLLDKNANRRLVVAEVSNDSNSTYQYVDMCANLRDGRGRLLELASVDPFGMPIVELAPGERRVFPLWFNDLPEGTVEFVARGSLKHANNTPNAAFNGLTVVQRDELVDASGRRWLRIVGEIDVSAWPDIGGLRLSAHVDGDYSERVDGVEAGCNTLADAALRAPVQFSIPLDSSALLRKLVVETILGTPGQNLHRLNVAEVAHQPDTGGAEVVSARIVNTSDARAHLLGVCLLLRDQLGQLVGATSVAAVQYLAPGESVVVSGQVVPLGRVASADAVAFAHVPS